MTVVCGRGDADGPLAPRHGPRAAQYLEGQLPGLAPRLGHQVPQAYTKIKLKEVNHRQQSHAQVQVLVQLVYSDVWIFKWSFSATLSLSSDS